MATIINPITTVLLSREEFESSEYDRFPFKYILEDEGTITYFSKLTAGRFLLSHEAQIPGLGKNRKAEAPKAIIQPLAHGHKVPVEMFYMIKQFFLDVMDMGPSTYEAQAFVVWNEGKKDYRIVIPKQKVSAAAVRYDIGEMLSDDDVIIVDIHSHNDMRAFFSGTDDRDDKKNPWISGVFGKLSSAFEHKFRFNDGCGRHFEMDAKEIFSFSDSEFVTPSEWLAQVELQAHAPVRPKGSWQESLGTPRSGGSDWTAPNEGDMDFFFEDTEGDLYDDFVDALHDLDPKEAQNVLSALRSFMDDPQTSTLDLSEREMSAFTDASYSIVASGDPDAASAALVSLTKAY